MTKSSDIKMHLEDIESVDRKNRVMLDKNFDNTAIFFQTTLNSFQRHIADAVIFRKFNNNTTDSKVSMTTGFPYKLAQQTFATYPALCIKKELQDSKSSKLIVNFGTALADTLFGTPFEIASFKKRIEEKKGERLSLPNAARGSMRAFFPFLVRNNLSWFGINADSSDLLEKMVQGAVLGAMAVPFHNLGTQVADHYDKSIAESWKLVKAEIIKNPFSYCKGGLTRAAAISTSSVVLSGTMHDIVKKSLQYFIEDMQPPSTGMHNKSSKQTVMMDDITKNSFQDFIDDTQPPSTSPQNKSSKQMKGKSLARDE